MELHTESIGRDAAELIEQRLRDAGFTLEPNPIQTPPRTNSLPGGVEPGSATRFRVTPSSHIDNTLSIRGP